VLSDVLLGCDELLEEELPGFELLLEEELLESRPVGAPAALVALVSVSVLAAEVVELVELDLESLEPEPTLMSDETLVTPCVSSASAIARPTISALSAVPFSVTSPLLASTSIEAFETSLSAWSLPLTIVSITSSSEAPVGAPTALSFERTIVTPRSRSAWSSAEPRRHSVMRDDTSVDVLLAVMSLEVLPEVENEPVAPVVLVEPAPAAPVVPEVLVVSLAIVLLLVLGCWAAVSVLDEVELAAPVAATEPVAEAARSCVACVS
jgi:hypothetical protein